MTQQFSQTYKVDNRYSGVKDAVDDTAAQKFLARYLQSSKLVGRPNVEEQRKDDDRFVLPAQGGTVPIAALPYEPRGAASIGSTDRRIGFRNLFRAEQA